MSIDPKFYQATDRSEAEYNKIWKQMVDEWRVTKGPGNYGSADEMLVRRYIYFVKHIAYHIIEPNWTPPPDHIFELKCSEYHDAWEAFKPSMIDTSKTYTVKDKK